MRFATIAFLLALCTPAAAGTIVDDKDVAVLSLVGDSMTVVTYRPAIGGHTDRNAKQVVRLPGPALDDAVLRAVNDVLSAQAPTARPALLRTSALRSIDAQSRLFDDRRFLPTDELKASLAGGRFGYLLLITKHRAPARLQTYNSKIGQGTLEGLGFYLDHNYRLRNIDTGEGGEGFIAPFVYIRVSLIDLASSNIVQEETLTESSVLTIVLNRDAHNAWEILSPAEKMQALLSLVSRTTSYAVETLLKAK